MHRGTRGDLAALSCSGDAPSADEGLGELRQALTTNDSILGFEGAVGGAASEWTAGAGTTAASSNAAFSGAHALSLSGCRNPSAISAKLTTLGLVGTAAKLQVSLPSSMQGQDSVGKVSLIFDSPSTGIHNQHTPPTALVGPFSQYHQYSIPIPASVIAALSTKTYGDLTITVQLEDVPETLGQCLIDQLTLGQPASDAGTDANDASVDREAGVGPAQGAGGASGTGGERGSGTGESEHEHENEHHGGAGKSGGSGAGGRQDAGACLLAFA